MYYFLNEGAFYIYCKCTIHIRNILHITYSTKGVTIDHINSGKKNFGKKKISLLKSA